MIEVRSPTACPACQAADQFAFYEVGGVPIHSVLRLATPELARAYPRGDISLCFCRACGFIYNSAFEPQRLEYGSEYEETQTCSPTFRDFHRRLAERLIDRYDLRRKRILEIGCGKGEFLGLLCDLGANSGIGFDPSYDPQRGPKSPAIEIVPELYSGRRGSCGADFVCCKMTLEHLQPVLEFVSMLRRAVGERPGTVVFFQVPDFGRIARECAFWDIYYEHCSYFTVASLAALFRRCAFEVIETWTDYGDQYLMIEARAMQRPAVGGVAEDVGDRMAAEIAAFSRTCRGRVSTWRKRLGDLAGKGRRAVVWGGGSKAVSFLAAVDRTGVIEAAVDINPHKQGTYLAGGGQEIIAPERLLDVQPHTVIVMNPVYLGEVADSLTRLGLAPEIVCV